jgi:hypothetical protein
MAIVMVSVTKRKIWSWLEWRNTAKRKIVIVNTAKDKKGSSEGRSETNRIKREIERKQATKTG